MKKQPVKHGHETFGLEFKPPKTRAMHIYSTQEKTKIERGTLKTASTKNHNIPT